MDQQRRIKVSKGADKEMIKLGTVFSGIGAVEHALEILEIPHEISFACDNGERRLKTSYDDIVAATKGMSNSERNAYVADLYNTESGINYVEQEYKANYRICDDNFYQDVKLLDGNEYHGQIDLFVGGSPCQSFSIMGKRGGLEEARGTLFYEYARLVDEIQPKVFIYENVTGMLNHDGGHTWEVISSILVISDTCGNTGCLMLKILEFHKIGEESLLWDSEKTWHNIFSVIFSWDLNYPFEYAVF
jgi:DNA (cytosine-5)-methyltransferase 1